MPWNRLRNNAGGIYIFLQAAWALFWALAFTLSLVFQVDVAHLSPMQLVLVGTVLEATCFIAEIPTGIVADLYSRRASIIIGLAILGVGISVVGVFPSFWPIVVAQVVWGVGYTFVSGSSEAWVTDELGEENVQAVFTRGHQLALLFNIVGILAAGAVALLTGSMRWSIIIGGAGFVAMALLMIFIMPETGFQATPKDERESFAHMADIARTGLNAARKPGVVRSFLLIGLLTGLTSEVFDRLWVDRLARDLTLPPWFGANSLTVWFTVIALISSAVGLVASVAANKLAPKAMTAEHPTRVMALLSFFQVLGVVVFALAGNAWIALVGRWARAAATSIGTPVRRAWLNRHVDSKARATTGSMMSQADALGQVVGGPVLGALAGIAGIPVALLAASAVQLPTVANYLRLKPNATEKATDAVEVETSGAETPGDDLTDSLSGRDSEHPTIDPLRQE
ncbi:MFS transporter [Arsenicicoccus dermatophilus]|uniref:MFS transporter n=1 Tax=Arsenicicoccus dermatophilus TaxID=1076331 RepID=UPI0039170214